MNWREFQQITAQLFRQLGCDVQVDHQVSGARTKHNIDVWVTFKVHGFPVSWAVECKLWKERVKKSHVSTLQWIVDDVGADKGIVVSDSGFQKGAIASTRKTNISLVSTDDLRMYLAEHLAGMEHRQKCANPSRAVSVSWREQLDKLPANSPTDAYKPYILDSYDQAVQKAAIRCLIAPGGAEAVLVLAKRMLNPWGMSAISATQKALGQLEQNGGAFVLMGFLLCDARFYYERLKIVAKLASDRGDTEAREVITTILQQRVAEGMHYTQQLVVRLPSDIAKLRSVANPDVALGVELSAFYCSPAWAGVVKSSGRLEAALAYANERLPGLIDILQQLDLSAVA